MTFILYPVFVILLGLLLAPVPQPRVQQPIHRSQWREGLIVRWYDPYDRVTRVAVIKRHPHYNYWCIHWQEIETGSVYQKTMNYYRALPDDAKLYPVYRTVEREWR